MRQESRCYHSHTMSHKTEGESKMLATAKRWFWVEVGCLVVVALGGLL